MQLDEVLEAEGMAAHDSSYVQQARLAARRLLPSPPAGAYSQLLQVYDQGAACDTTGAKRAAIVRFECGSSAEIAGVLESASCSYQLTVHAPKLCEHPGACSGRPGHPWSRWAELSWGGLLLQRSSRCRSLWVRSSATQAGQHCLGETRLAQPRQKGLKQERSWQRRPQRAAAAAAGLLSWVAPSPAPPRLQTRRTRGRQCVRS